MENEAPGLIHADTTQPLSTHAHLVGVARVIQARAQPAVCSTREGAAYNRSCFSAKGPWDRTNLVLSTDTLERVWQYHSAGELNRWVFLVFTCHSMVT